MPLQYHPELSCNEIEYVGTDLGEWGGELTAKNKKGESKVVLEGNIYHLVKSRDWLYVFVGIQHMMSGGSIYSVSNCGSMDSEAELITLLPDAPIDVDLGNRPDLTQFYIFGGTSIMYLIPQLGIFEVLEFDPWKGIRPTTSIQLEDGIFLVGLHSGIATVDLRSGTKDNIKVYVPFDKAQR